MKNIFRNAVEGILERMQEKKLDIRLAMEVIAFGTSLFADGLEHTIKIESDIGKEVLFYSSLPEDEARFWHHPIKIIQELQRPDINSCRKYHWMGIGSLEGVWILENQKRKIPILHREEQEVIKLAFLSATTCLLAEEARNNAEKDSLTGMRGKKAFLRELLESSSDYLIAVRNTFSNRERDSDILRLAEICKEVQAKEVFRIEVGTFVFFQKDQDSAISVLQTLLEKEPEKLFFITSADRLNPNHAVEIILRELFKIDTGKVSDFYWLTKTQPLEAFRRI